LKLHKALIALSAIYILLTQMVVSAEADPSNLIDPFIPQRALVTKCKNQIQLDCVSNITLTRNDGSKVNLIHDDTRKLLDFKDKLGQIFDSNIDYWNFLTPSGKPGYLAIYSLLVTPTFDPGSTGNFPGYKLFLYKQSGIEESDLLEFNIQFSWLQPTQITRWGDGSQLTWTSSETSSQLNLKTHLTKIALTSKGVDPQVFTGGNVEYMANSVRDDIRLTIVDSRDPSVISNSCYSGKEFVEIESNMQFDSSLAPLGNGKIVGKIGKPTYLPDGSIYEGHYELNIPKELFECLYGTEWFANGTMLDLSILSKSGNAKVSSRVVSLSEKSGLHIAINGIVTGYPTVTLVLKGPDRQATSTIVTKEKSLTIICVKGKITKKVTAVNPRGPTGYKKK